MKIASRCVKGRILEIRRSKLFLRAGKCVREMMRHRQRVTCSAKVRELQGRRQPDGRFRISTIEEKLHNCRCRRHVRHRFCRWSERQKIAINHFWSFTLPFPSTECPKPTAKSFCDAARGQTVRMTTLWHLAGCRCRRSRRTERRSVRKYSYHFHTVALCTACLLHYLGCPAGERLLRKTCSRSSGIETRVFRSFVRKGCRCIDRKRSERRRCREWCCHSVDVAVILSLLPSRLELSIVSKLKERLVLSLPGASVPTFFVSTGCPKSKRSPQVCSRNGRILLRSFIRYVLRAGRCMLVVRRVRHRVRCSERSWSTRRCDKVSGIEVVHRHRFHVRRCACVRLSRLLRRQRCRESSAFRCPPLPF